MSTATTNDGRRAVAQALQIGALVQAVCILLPLLDLWAFHTIDAHVRSAYPAWGDDLVAADRGAIVVGLVVIGGLGLLCWIGALVLTRHGWHIRATVTTLFVIGLSALGLTAGLSGGAYERVVPLWLGLMLLVLPMLPGVTALVAAWTRADADRGAPTAQ